jgi:hypothetical protein
VIRKLMSVSSVFFSAASANDTYTCPPIGDIAIPDTVMMKKRQDTPPIGDIATPDTVR